MKIQTPFLEKCGYKKPTLHYCSVGVISLLEAKFVNKLKLSHLMMMESLLKSKAETYVTVRVGWFAATAVRYTTNRSVTAVPTASTTLAVRA